MKPYQTSTDSEHLPAFQFFFGRIIVFGQCVRCLPFPITSPANKGKVTPNCLVLIYFSKYISFILLYLYRQKVLLGIKGQFATLSLSVLNSYSPKQQDSQWFWLFLLPFTSIFLSFLYMQLFLDFSVLGIICSLLTVENQLLGLSAYFLPHKHIHLSFPHPPIQFYHKFW